MKSLRTRLLVVASCVLAAFLLLCGLALEQAFRAAAQQGEQDRLEGMVFALLGAAEAGPNGTLTIPANALPDARLGHVQSGLEALIFNERGKVVWRSPNFLGAVPLVQAPEVGVSVFREIGGRFTLSYGVRWVGDSGAIHLLSATPRPKRYTVALLHDEDAYHAQINSFRQILWFGLGGSAVALILVQFFVLRWGLSPLRRLVRELHRVETGEQSRIESDYATELTPLANGLNAMIQAERTQQTRYRNALDDLAHSLKTPLAVLRGVIDDEGADSATRARMRESVGRIQGITDHQLRKAAAAGRRTLAEPVAVRPIVDKLAGALGKVYAQKAPQFRVRVPFMLRVRADENDLYELLGNLMDNAGKWCKREIAIEAEFADRKLRIVVEDDGPGFPENAAELLLRGARADTHVPGQGIGLGAIAEMVKVYDGSIELGHGALGGARVDVQLSV